VPSVFYFGSPLNRAPWIGSAVEISSPVAGAIGQEGGTMSTTPGKFMRDDEELSAVLFRSSSGAARTAETGAR
jgi:hypothetical protein